MAWWAILLLFVTGIFAGFINTLAGAGSVLSLAVMNLLGLPLDVANGTKRVAVLFQVGVAVTRFKQQGRLEVRKHIGLIAPAMVGGVLGALAAGQVDAEVFRRSVGICMLIVLGLLFLKPKRWLEGNVERQYQKTGPGRVISFFLIGLYGGYIQVGVGVFLLTALVLVAGVDLVKGNALKALLALCFTVPSLIIFSMNDLVRWDVGLPLAAGSMLGAWLATHEAAKRGAPFIRWLLIVVVTLSAIFYLFF